MNQSEIAYEHIKKKLLNAELPSGSKVSYGSVGKEIGVSATPVREAVNKLASEGFLELVPQQGALVRSLNRDDAVDLFEAREALESFAAGKAAERISDRQLRDLKENLEHSAALVEDAKSEGQEGANPEIARAFHAFDLAFHMQIIEGSRNRRILKTVGDSHILTRIFLAQRHAFEIDILTDTQDDHERIYEAIAKRDATEARAAMERHIRNSLQLTLTGGERWWENA